MIKSNKLNVEERIAEEGRFGIPERCRKANQKKIPKDSDRYRPSENGRALSLRQRPHRRRNLSSSFVQKRRKNMP